MGRPSSYSDDIALTICTRLSEGEALKRICADDGMPDRTTVNAWRRDRPAFSAMFARAREDAGDTLAEAAVAVAMTATPETAQAVRVKYDALRWYASKLGPKTYGDKLQHTGDPSSPVNFVIRAPTPVSSTAEWLERYRPKDIEGKAENAAPDDAPLAPLPLAAPVEPAAQPSTSPTTTAWLDIHGPKRDYGG
jgi:hypothetical protein